MWILKNFPMSPSVNATHAVRSYGGSARILKTQEGRLFDKQVEIWILRNQQLLHKIKPEIESAMKESQLKVMLYYCFNHSQLWTKDNRVKQLDTNNRIKPALDGISRAIGIDDRHIFAEEHEKVETDENPHIMVAIGLHKPALKKNLWIAQDNAEKPLVN
jgi:hypothetical protein